MDDGDRRITVEHDPGEGVYRARHAFDGAGELSTSVILAVESVVASEGRPDSPPLNRAVDPDALDALFRPIGDRDHRSRGQVRFMLAELEVTVSGDGTIEIRPPDDG